LLWSLLWRWESPTGSIGRRLPNHSLWPRLHLAGAISSSAAGLARIIEEHPGQSIGEVKDSPSTGVTDNVDRLLDGSADIALLVDEQALDHDIRVLAKLGTDVIQVVARRPASKHATSRPVQRPKSIRDSEKSNRSRACDGSSARRRKLFTW
jgi:DNA-binding transcriptional LysR family regulator